MILIDLMARNEECFLKWSAQNISFLSLNEICHDNLIKNTKMNVRISFQKLKLLQGLKFNRDMTQLERKYLNGKKCGK